ncbi:lysophospholipid acyltransferase family protein [Flavilitoribacter nigricans]|uniref:Acyltransferase n=1 Tax=Flavilitoribacter nigricans (strain ATCC 23147 / DSM 23189 / NBRC 102662 / NCIMB 1420 / SS-2) TaxID=1122177 RepID=A0A2D0NIN9_FLAN2|nr:lysophospholipid acyltransferase family protein [Flavilitoribacter nigricans]PHN08308.1 acyltransferase [Flavilitoribacter nigricans DSM 23189 = NBRC 102662]
MIQAVSKFILNTLGWRLDLHPKPWPDKYIIIVIPHTSNWDFPLGLLVREAMDEDIRYVGKDSLFKSPFGFLFRWLGGIPVDRSRRNKFVDAVVDKFEESEHMKICIAPEGTRKRVEKLKTGFYYIAKGAEVPIIFCKFDYGKKVIGTSEPYYTTESMEADFAAIYEYFKGVEGKVPGYSFN